MSSHAADAQLVKRARAVGTSGSTTTRRASNRSKMNRISARNTLRVKPSAGTVGGPTKK
jgi:hypothetical protein